MGSIHYEQVTCKWNWPFELQTNKGSSTGITSINLHVSSIKYGVSKLTHYGIVSQVPQFKCIQQIVFYITSLAKHVFHDVSVLNLFNLCRNNEPKAINWHFSKSKGIKLCFKKCSIVPKIDIPMINLYTEFYISVCNLCGKNDWKLLVDRTTDRQQQPSLLRWEYNYKTKAV